MPTTKVLLGAVALVAALVVAGLLLARSGGPVEPPSDYATFTGEVGGRTVSFAYPRAWGEVRATGEMDGAELQVEGPRAQDGTASIIQLLGEGGVRTSFDSVYGVSRASVTNSLRRSEVAEEADVDVEGAAQARRRVTTYDLQTRAGDTRGRLSAVIALADDGVLVNLSVATTAEDPDVDARAVLDSLSLDG
jgi:hypothetical protein